MIFIVLGIFLILMVGLLFFFMRTEKKQEGANTKQITANELTNVRDIKGNFLYTKDGYLVIYLKVMPYNADLLSQEEKRAKTNALSASFEGDRKAFTYFTYPREIDMDGYKQDIKNAYIQELADLGSKRILQMMLKEATELSTNGENFEHQHYIRLWRKIGTEVREAEKELMARAEDWEKRYAQVGIQSYIANQDEIIKICNLFANPIQAAFDINPSNLLYDPIFKDLK